MLIQNEEQLAYAIGKLQAGSPMFIMDLETSGVKPFSGDRLCGIAFLVFDTDGQPDESFYAPYRHTSESLEWAGDVNLPIKTLYDFAPILADRNRLFLNTNTKFDVHMLEQDGFAVFCRQADLMQAAHLVDENLPHRDMKHGPDGRLKVSYALENLAHWYLGPDQGKKEGELNAWSKEHLGIANAKSVMPCIPPRVVAGYAEGDVWLVWNVLQKLLPRIEAEGLTELLYQVWDYGKIIQEMERTGALLNMRTCRKGLLQAQRRADSLYKQVVAIHGSEFNANSWRQKQAVLGTTGSTSRKVIEELDHPCAKLLAERGQWQAAVTNYFQKYLDYASHDGRLHPSLETTGTVAARLSCRGVNLQGVARDSDVFAIREVIVAPEGYVIVSSDYNQAELRWMAFYTQDYKLLEAQHLGLDLHQSTADAIGIDRQSAKTLNFSIVYGLGVPGAVRRMGWTEKFAVRTLGKYHALYPGIRQLYRQCQKQAEKHGYLKLWTGRRRHFSFDAEPHKAMSNLVQGAVAEMIRVAMQRLDWVFLGSRCDPFLQIHDDILTYVPIEEVDLWVPKIKETMEDFELSLDGRPETRVPMKVDIKVGKTWGSGMQKWVPGLFPPPPPPESRKSKPKSKYSTPDGFSWDDFLGLTSQPSLL